MVAEALAEAKRIEVGEVANPPIRPPCGDNFDDDDDEEPERCWWDEEEKVWMTDFPPPAGYDGYEVGRWQDEDYRRECTREEAEALAASMDAETAEERAADETLRDEWFRQLRSAGGPSGTAASAE